jgi:DNA replication protein DnaC
MVTEIGAAIGPAVGPPPGLDEPRYPPGACGVCGVVHKCQNAPSCHDLGWLKAEHDQLWLLNRDQQMVRCTCGSARPAELLARVSGLEALDDLTFEAFDGSVADVANPLEAARAFAGDPTGWLLLYGSIGSGKTHLAAAVCHELVGRGYLVVFQDVPTLLDHLRATHRKDSQVHHDDLFAAIRDAEVLVLDDLGTERETTFGGEELFKLLTHRRKLPTVVTTNKSRADFRSTNDQRIASRLWDRGHVATVFCAARDYRQRPLSERKVVAIADHRAAKGATS